MGDCVISIADKIIVDNTKNLPTIMCEQRKAPKKVPTEKDFFESNKASFGNLVGSTTNNVTGMIEVQSRFEVGTREYNVLDYRIKCGQLYQQNAIDKAKGIECNEMPSEWTDFKPNIPSEFKSVKENNRCKLNLRILANKKPYFMIYRYEQVKKEYDTYIKNVSNKCVMQFRMKLNDLLNAKEDDLTEEQIKFRETYYNKLPVGISPCMINRICWKIENIFDVREYNKVNPFDYTILKPLEYHLEDECYNYNDVKKKIVKLYNEYQLCTERYNQTCKETRIENDEKSMYRSIMKDTFKVGCEMICNNKYILSDIILDICYTNNNSKQFVWDVCGDTLIDNLLEKNNYNISFPTKNKDGDIYFNGERFSVETINLNSEEEK